MLNQLVIHTFVRGNENLVNEGVKWKFAGNYVRGLESGSRASESLSTMYLK